MLWYIWIGHIALIVLLPLGFFLIQYEYTASALMAETEILATDTSRFVAKNPEWWPYEAERLRERLTEYPTDAKTMRRILDKNNRVVAGNDIPVPPPAIRQTADLSYAGTVAGRVETARSLHSILFRTGIATLITFCLGILSFRLFYILYIRARKSEEEIRLQSAVMEAVEEGIVLFGLDDHLIKWTNGKLEAAFGYEPGEMIGMHIDEIIAPTDRTPEEIRSDIGKMATETGEFRLEIKNIRKDGTTFWNFIHLSYFDHPRFGQVVVSAHTDISARKEAENDLRESDERLRRSEERYRGILENIEEAYYEVDRNGCYIFFNPSAESNLGYTKDEIMGTSYRQYMDEAEARKASRIFRQVWQTGESVPAAEWRMIAKTGKRMDIESSISLIRDAEGRPSGFRGIGRDITERKRLEEERHHHERLQNILEMAGTVCHEMSQPMQIISGLSEIIMRKIPADEPIYGKLNSIVREIQRMKGITGKLMSLRQYKTRDYAGFTQIIDIHESHDEPDCLMRKEENEEHG